MKPITICFTHFRSLSLANFEAALYSVSRQDLSRVKEIVILDNASGDSLDALQSVLDDMNIAVPLHLRYARHEDKTRTHSWSTNMAVSLAESPWILFTRADFLLDFALLEKFSTIAEAKPWHWDGFVTSNFVHLHVPIVDCERSGWRANSSLLRLLPGVEQDYSVVDAGVWMARRESFVRVGGLDERLTAWGHAQTHFQHKLAQSGVEFVRISEPLFYHPVHGGEKDIELAHRQLADVGGDLKDMWKRYEGPSPY